MTNAQDIIKELGLKPHPEGGYFRRTYRNDVDGQQRGRCSAIYYLLDKEGFALWHRIDADELWHWHAGAPMTLEIGTDRTDATPHTLGPDILEGERPQVLVPANHWQRARADGAWSLVSCVVAPEFLFETFEIPDGEIATTC
ncbi:cupin domain-containing protein [Kordiimonas lacus]|uniref:DUF985 domain-containing protein n=1 Tax=Kordiimonas lacus TaxID=637679 RepID=A0A1G7D3N8_9PROT|nr:cupin domain-containing protein [Kordiimonas lacus]SDE46127.1 hypothetical protein SAMN04488071_2943 [Kordiimonas lacus]